MYFIGDKYWSFNPQNLAHCSLLSKNDTRNLDVWDILHVYTHYICIKNIPVVLYDDMYI